MVKYTYHIFTFIFQMIIRKSKSSALMVCLVTLFSVLCIIGSVSAVAVMSVDLGTEWMKVAVVSVSENNS